MLRIRCPHCGLRDESEFRYRGDASAIRPAPGAGTQAFVDYVYQRMNPKGLHLEWWLHVGGCRMLLHIERHTMTHAIVAVSLPGDIPSNHGDPEP